MEIASQYLMRGDTLTQVISHLPESGDITSPLHCRNWHRIHWTL